MLIASAVLALTWSARASERVTHRFGADRLNTRILVPIGRDAIQSMTQTRDGLLVRLPIDKPGGGTQAGVETRFRLEGDFEITLGYELVDVKQPQEGYGVGVVLRLPKGGESQGHAGFARRKLANGKDVFTTVYRTYVGGEARDKGKRLDAEADRGRLRLVRTGPTLRFLVAEGDAAEFRQLDEIEFGLEPVKSVQIVGDTGGSTQPMTVRLIDLSIRADGLPIGMPTAQAHSIWGTWSILALAGGAVLVGAGIWYWRQRR